MGTQWNRGIEIAQFVRNMDGALQDIIDIGAGEYVSGLQTPYKTFVERIENLRRDKSRLVENVVCQCEGVKNPNTCFKASPVDTNCQWSIIVSLMTGLKDPLQEFEFYLYDAREFSENKNSCQGKDHNTDIFKTFGDLTDSRVKIHRVDACGFLDDEKKHAKSVSSSSSSRVLTAHFYETNLLAKCFTLILPNEDMVDIMEPHLNETIDLNETIEISSDDSDDGTRLNETIEISSDDSDDSTRAQIDSDSDDDRVAIDEANILANEAIENDSDSDNGYVDFLQELAWISGDQLEQ